MIGVGPIRGEPRGNRTLFRRVADDVPRLRFGSYERRRSARCSRQDSNLQKLGSEPSGYAIRLRERGVSGSKGCEDTLRARRHTRLRIAV